jgi:predicted amidohydrolase
VKVAAYQAPYLPFGSFEAVGLIEEQLVTCEAEQVEVLCCPEAIIGGLAHESDGQSPADVALGVDNGELAGVISALVGSPVTVIIGFTERDPVGNLFNSAAIVADGELAAIQRKVFPGYRTVIRAGTELPVFDRGAAPFGVMICNDIWYLEPARVLAARGAATIFVPTNSGHVRPDADASGLRARGDNLPVARAVENSTSIVVADITGRQSSRRAIGCSRIVDPDGVVIAAADPDREALLIAEVEGQRRGFDPRGWDGYLNPAVTESFTALWRRESTSSDER